MRLDSWHTSALLRESAKNVYSLHSRLYVVVIISIILGLSNTLLIAFEQSTLQSQIGALTERGRHGVVFASSDEASPVRISRSSCEQLTGLEGIDHAGLFVERDRKSFLQLGPSVPTGEASPTLFPELVQGDVVIGGALSSGQVVNIYDEDLGQVLHGVVGSSVPRGFDAQSMVIYPLSPLVYQADMCAVVFSKYADLGAMTIIAQSELDIDGGTVQANQRLRLPLDPVELFLQRPGRYAPAAVGLCGGLICGVLNRARSSELAAYRLAGMSSRSMMLVLGVEQVHIGGIFFLSASAASWALLWQFANPWIPTLSALVAAATWTIVAMSVSLPTSYISPIKLAKDR